MEWESQSLYNKAKLYAQRAHNEPVDSALFAFWMSLSIELLARAALSMVHPVLLADPREEANIFYAFGINPERVPKSVFAKTLFSRCSLFVTGFTDKMAAHCLIVSNRRNAELHSGDAAFEGLDNSKWLPATYEVAEVLLKHLARDFRDFLGDHGDVAAETLKDRRENLKKEVQERLSKARKGYQEIDADVKATIEKAAEKLLVDWLGTSKLRKECKCPACGNKAVVGGETVSRSPAKIDEESVTISHEIRVLPNKLRCPYCRLLLTSFQEINEAGLGKIYTIVEEDDPLEFFGIDPEEHVDVQEFIEKHAADYYGEYNNE